jgi:hypothetical protein
VYNISFYSRDFVATLESSIVIIEFDEKYESGTVISEFSLGNSPISSFTVCADERFIIVTTEDGFMWTIEFSEEVLSHKKERGHFFSDEILIKRADISAYDQMTVSLKAKIEGMNEEHSNLKVAKDDQHDFRINDLTSKFMVEINDLTKVLFEY